MWERFGLRGARLAEAIGPQFFPPASTAKVLPGTHLVAQGSIMNFSPNFPCLQVSHHVGGGRCQEGEEGHEDHKQKGKKSSYRNTTCGFSSQEGFYSKFCPQRGYV